MRARKISPEDYPVLYAFGVLCLQMDLIKDATSALDRAAQIRPDSVSAAYALASAKVAGGDLRSALEIYKRLIEADAAAVQELQTAIRIAPAYVKAHHNLGLAYQASNDFAHARQSFERAIELNGEQQRPSSWPYTDYAGFLNRRNDFAGALTLCRLAVEADPRADAAWFEMAKAYRGLADTDQSVKALERATELQRKPDYLYVLSQAYRKQGREEAARKVLSESQSKAGTAETLTPVAGMACSS